MINKILIFGRYAQDVKIGGPMGFFNQNISGASGFFFDTSSYHIDFPRWINYLIRIIKPEKAQKILFFKTIRKMKIPNGFYMNKFIIETMCKYYFSNARNYRLIYVHDPFTFYSIWFLKPKNQKIIFQPHSPELFSNEVKYFSNNEEHVNFVKKIESILFKQVEIYVFPNIGATEIYQNVLGTNKKLYYLNSACRKCSNPEYKKVNEEKINLIFIGRRNEVKGFDIVINAFQQARKNRDDIELYLLGPREEIIEMEGIHDIGFSNEAMSWIYSCDYVVNMNRQSYFDLIVMETLSIGTPLIINTSGGHVIFKEIKSKGIIPLSNLTELEYILCSKILRKKNNQQVEENINLYQQNFSIDKYRQNLDLLCKEIVNTF
jgi:glycosyltransferase involved in cell wall biosynthesis